MKGARGGRLSLWPDGGGAVVEDVDLGCPIFYTTVHDRLLRPLLAANAPPAPAELRTALRTIDQHVTGCIDAARLGKAT